MVLGSSEPPQAPHPLPPYDNKLSSVSAAPLIEPLSDSPDQVISYFRMVLFLP